MKLYRTAKGWVGTQADANKLDKETAEQIDVPVDKAGLLEWLNDNCRSEASAPVADAVDTPDAALGKCPKCNMTQRGAEARVKALKIDEICERIQFSTGIEIIRLTEAVVDRQQDFLRDLNRSS